MPRCHREQNGRQDNGAHHQRCVGSEDGEEDGRGREELSRGVVRPGGIAFRYCRRRLSALADRKTSFDAYSEFCDI